MIQCAPGRLASARSLYSGSSTCAASEQSITHTEKGTCTHAHRHTHTHTHTHAHARLCLHAHTHACANAPRQRHTHIHSSMGKVTWPPFGSRTYTHIHCMHTHTQHHGQGHVAPLWVSVRERDSAHRHAPDGLGYVVQSAFIEAHVRRVDNVHIAHAVGGRCARRHLRMPTNST
jgi:hypothetical protein